MKSTLLVLPLLLLVACETPSANSPGAAPAAAVPQNTPGLPFGDMRVVGQTRLDQTPTPEFMPSPLELRGEFARRKVSGDAVIAFTVPPKGGAPEKIEVKQTTSPELAQLAVAYVTRLRFRPARVAGTPVACDMEMPFFAR